MKLVLVERKRDKYAVMKNAGVELAYILEEDRIAGK